MQMHAQYMAYQPAPLQQAHSCKCTSTFPVIDKRLPTLVQASSLMLQMHSQYMAYQPAPPQQVNQQQQQQPEFRPVYMPMPYGPLMPMMPGGMMPGGMMPGMYGPPVIGHAMPPNLANAAAAAAAQAQAQVQQQRRVRRGGECRCSGV